MESKKVLIKILDKEWELKITLGFWKDLSFKKAEINEVYSDYKKLFECLKLALFYGNKKAQGWKSLADMAKDLSDEILEEIDFDIVDLIGTAFLEFMPDKLKKAIKEMQDEKEQEESKKK